MVSGYGKSGDLAAAREVFGRMPGRNLVSWSAMIDALVRAAEFDEALQVFDRMMGEGFKPDVVVLVSVLKACAHLGAVERGRWVHRYMETEGFAGTQRNVMAETALVDMYCKCGCMEEAWRAFDSVRCRDVVLWNSMIGGLAMNGHGRVEEAETVLLDMPMEPHASQWGALMSSCRMHNDITVGERVGKRLIELEPQHGGRYAVLFNLYAVNGRWEDARAIRQMMVEKGAKKELGFSFME
uniref:Pentatricopeptide repeat-containing protein n=1 Tax=Aegilops tauschii TaxID=37682 RepID=R7WC53_AEGTA